MASGSTLASDISDIRQRVRAIESARRPVSATDDPQRIIAAQRIQIDNLKRENKQLQEGLTHDTKVGQRVQFANWYLGIACLT